MPFLFPTQWMLMPFAEQVTLKEDQTLVANGKAKFSLGHGELEVLLKLPVGNSEELRGVTCHIHLRLTGKSISVGAMILEGIA